MRFKVSMILLVALLCNGVMAQNSPAQNDITLDGIVGRELLVDRNGLILRGRFFYAKQRLYQLILTAPPNVVFRDGKPSPNPKDRTDLFEKTSAKFFDSFKLTK